MIIRFVKQVAALQSPLPERAFRRISPPMNRFFDMADHDRLPQRFTALIRSVLARA
jgi:hypothetical protein